MTEQRMLILAAKAFGCYSEGFSVVTEKGIYNPLLEETWNSLTNSNDAFELSVKLHMDVHTALWIDSKRYSPARVVIGELEYAGTEVIEPESYWPDEFDPLATTRLAITRAAAIDAEKRYL